MFADETRLIHLHADERHDFPELETLLLMLVRFEQFTGEVRVSLKDSQILCSR
jgi:hypothetical protein